MKLDDVVAEIREHQRTAPEREVCGFVLREADGALTVLRAENIAPAGDLAAPDARALREALTGARALVFSYHTHAHDCEGATDQPYCDGFGVPYLVVSPTRIQILQPAAPWAGLLERRWEWGTCDCATLCFAFADLVHGIGPAGPLPQWPGDDWTGEGEDFFYGVHAGLGLVCVEPPWRFGDFLSFRVPSLETRRPGENHLAVYLGDGKILQVFIDGVVHEAELDERAQKYLAFGYRWLQLERAG